MNKDVNNIQVIQYTNDAGKDIPSFVMEVMEDVALHHPGEVINVNVEGNSANVSVFKEVS